MHWYALIHIIIVTIFSSFRYLATELLDRVSAPELIADAIQHNFRPYLKKSKLDDNEILVGYCMHLMNSNSILFYFA